MKWVENAAKTQNELGEIPASALSEIRTYLASFSGSGLRGFQTPPAEMTNIARGNDQRRTRGLSSPHAAFFVSFFEETLFQLLV